MKCGSCTKKCNNVHCSFTYNIVEACQSGKLFKEKGTQDLLKFTDTFGFKYIKYLKDDKVYDIKRTTFDKEFLVVEVDSDV